MREYVMAILCSRISASELQTAEKNNSVFVIRKLDYNELTSAYIANRKFLENFDAYPYKLMFVFDKNEAIVVRNTVDKQEVQRKLMLLDSYSIPQL